MARPYKEFQQYLIDGDDPPASIEDYWLHPATALLRYLVEAKDAVNLCQNNFNKNTNGEYTQASLDTIRHINQAMLPAIMGHFETFLRNMYGGVFDFSAYFTKFDVEDFFKRVNKVSEVSFSPMSLAPYRGKDLRSIGIVLADNMSGWHDPKRVNLYFRCFGFKVDVLSNEDCKRLKVLWQLRHSIVHTGGTLTMADAQKIPELEPFGDKPIILENNFTFEVARKLHPIVFNVNARVRDAVLEKLPDGWEQIVNDDIDQFFDARTSVSAWIPSNA